MKNALLLSVACLTMLAMSGCCQLKATPMTARQLLFPMQTQTIPATLHYYGSDDQYDYFKLRNVITCKRKVPIAENLVAKKDRYRFTSWSHGRRMYDNILTGLTYDKPAPFGRSQASFRDAQVTAAEPPPKGPWCIRAAVK